jgi:hypothetical protein
MNLFDLVESVYKAYSKVDDTPLHVGEIMNLWTMLTATQNFANMEEVCLNIVEDKELKEKMRDLVENYHKPIMKHIEDLLIQGGVSTAQPPKKKPPLQKMIPSEGGMTDEEIANMVVFNLVWAIKHCARSITESVRADVGQLFTLAVMQKTAFAATLRSLMAERGWLKVPPIITS